MITRVQVKNFRSIAAADIELAPITVLVGKNGAGKSAVVDVLRFVRDAFQNGLKSAFDKRQGIASLRRWSSHRPYDLDIALTVKEGSFHAEYGFTIASKGQDAFRVKREFCRFLTPESRTYSYEIREGEWRQKPHGENNSFPNLLYVLHDFLGTSGITELSLPALMVLSPVYSRIRLSLIGDSYSIFPNTLRAPQILSGERVLAEDGSNLASVLRVLRKDSKAFPDLLSALRRVVEGVSDLRVRTAGSHLFVELEHQDLLRPKEVKASQNGNSATATKATPGKPPWLDLSQESDGTLRMLGMLVALYQDNRYVNERSFLALEEPENALHPGALAVLSDVIREASERCQIIVTTQSPDFISHFQVEELRVVERVGGVTLVGLVDSVQRRAVVEQLFSAGDLLRMEGLHREPEDSLATSNISSPDA